MIQAALSRLKSDKHLAVALRGSAVSLIVKLVAACASFALTLIIARRFGAAGSGMWALATTLLGIAVYLALCGLDYGTTRAIAVRRASNDWAAARAWFLTACLIITAAGAVLTTALWCGAPAIADSLGEPATFAGTMRTISLALVPCAFLRLTAAALRGAQRFAAAEIIESGALPGSLAVALILSNTDSLTSVASLYIALASATALTGIATCTILASRQPAGLGRLNPADALKRSLPLAGTVLATLASPWLVTLFLAHAASPSELGIYRVSLQIFALLGFLLSAVEAGLSPQMAALHSQGRLSELSSAAKRMTLLLIIGGGLPALLLLLFADQVLGIMGPEFSSGAGALRILVAAQIFNLATGPVGSLMVMTGLERWSLWNAIAGTLLVVLLGALLIPPLGIEGAAIATGAATVLRNLSATLIVWLKHGLFVPLGIRKG